MLLLRKHNKDTYTNLIKLFAVKNKVAVVQPTGTGKSFIILQLIADNIDKKFIITAPSTYIFLQIKTHAANYNIDLENVSFITYSTLIKMSMEQISNLECDYIVLDEFHRCGASEWSIGVNNLIDNHKNSKLLGTSATPIRYLDSLRNMADELFDGNYAVNMSLAEAIKMKILPLPIYIASYYSFWGEVEQLRIRAERTGNPKLKFVLLGKIQQAKRMLTELDCGIDGILKKHIKKKSSKFIVFCSGIDKLDSAFEDSTSWFEKINPNIHKYKVHSNNNESQKEFNDFADDNDLSAIKLLFCVDMLNEGVHIDDIDGVIMLRSTQSANVFYQQLGRALSCTSDVNKHPLIFDIVNNFETGDTAQIYSQIMEISNQQNSSSSAEINFEIFDYVHDIREILDNLHQSFELSWQLVFDELANYVRINNRFPTTNENYNGFLLGKWCINQRQLYKNNRLNQEQIDKLNSIDFVWNYNDDIWQMMLKQAKDFYETHNRFPVKSDISDNDKTLYQWLTNQKTIYKQGNMPEERKQALLEIGFEIKAISPNELWNTRFEEYSDYKKKNGHFPTYSETIGNEAVQILYTWALKQQGRIASGKMTDAQMCKLNDLGFIFDNLNNKWNTAFEIFADYVTHNHTLPTNTTKYNNFSIGQWYIRQLKEYNAGNLKAEKIEKLSSLGYPLITAREYSQRENWLKKYEKVKIFINQNSRMPYAREISDGFNIYGWLEKQKFASSTGELEQWKIEKLSSIGIDITVFGATKKELNASWLSSYNELLNFIQHNNRMPKASVPSEKKLYSWLTTQKVRSKKKKLSDLQLDYLKALNVI